MFHLSFSQIQTKVTDPNCCFFLNQIGYQNAKNKSNFIVLIMLASVDNTEVAHTSWPHCFPWALTKSLGL